MFNTILAVLANALWQEKKMRSVNTGKEEINKTAIICRCNCLSKIEKKKSRIKTIWIDKSSGHWNRFSIVKLIILNISRGILENIMKRSIEHYKVKNESKVKKVKDTIKYLRIHLTSSAWRKTFKKCRSNLSSPFKNSKKERKYKEESENYL